MTPILFLLAAMGLLATRKKKLQVLPKLPDDPVLRSQELVKLIRQGAAEYKWADIKSQDGDRVLIMRVTAEPVKVAGVRINLTARGEQQAADALDVLLLTQKISDLIHEQADLKIQPQYQQWVNDGSMSRADRMVEYSQILDRVIAGRPFRLASNLGKDWILTPELFKSGNHPASLKPWKERGANYGWYQDSGKPIQPVGHAHGLDHADYSQLVRFVSPMAQLSLDGGKSFQIVKLADILTSNQYYPLASYQRLGAARHPGVPA